MIEKLEPHANCVYDYRGEVQAVTGLVYPSNLEIMGKINELIEEVEAMQEQIGRIVEVVNETDN